MMKNPTVGVIGCGAMGLEIVRLVAKRAPGIRIAGVYDPDNRSIEKFRAEFPGAKQFRSAGSLLKNKEINWVMIASWNCFHKEQVINAFEEGKNVFCQKPLATTFDDTLLIYDAWKRSGKNFMLGYTLRFSPHYRKIKSLIESGMIGDLISFEFNETLSFNHGGYIMGDWRRLTKYAGTHLLEKCSHDIDLANWMAGSRAGYVSTFGGLNFFKPENAYHIGRLGKNRKGKEAYSEWGGLVGLNPFTSEKDIIDNQVAIIEYENGVRGAFHTNCNCGIPERRMYINGSEGSIRADVLQGKIELKRIGFYTKTEDHSTRAKGIHGSGDGVLARELSEAMMNGTAPAAGMEEGMNSSITCFAIDEAMEKKKVVDVSGYWKKFDKLRLEYESR